MKKHILIFKILILVIIAQGCSGNISTNTTPACEWESTETVYMIGLALEYPTGMSPAHLQTIFQNTETDLIHLLETKGDGDFQNSHAWVRMNVKSDGQGCIGEEMVKYTKYNYQDHVSNNSIESPMPSNGFVGEVSVNIKSDIWNNVNGLDNFYHVIWEESANDYPYEPLNVNILGKKYSYAFIDGTNSIIVGGQDGYIISGGEKNYL